MNTQQLLCFVCAADHLNFTKAAEELYLSAPTVTHHIKNLENELNTLLFIRTSKMVKLTEAGQQFYTDAKDILSRIDIAEKKIQKIAQKDISFFQIGCTSYEETSFFLPVLKEMRKQYPHVYPRLTIQNYYALKNLLQSHQIDLMFATSEMISGISDCFFHKLRHSSTFVLLPKDSPLKNKKSLTFDDLKEETLITLHPKLIPFQNGNQLQEKLALYSQAYFNIVCENIHEASFLARCGYGAAILPDFYLPDHLEDFLVLPMNPEEELPVNYGIVCQKNEKHDFIRWFMKRVSSIIFETRS